MNRSVSLRIPKQWILPALTWNNSNTNINCFTLIIFMAILNPRHGLNNRFYPFYRHGKIAMQTGPALTVLVYKDKTARQLRRRVLQDFIFPVASLFARPVLARLKQYPIANLPEYNERSANLKHCQQPYYSFSWIPSIVGSCMEINEK